MTGPAFIPMLNYNSTTARHILEEYLQRGLALVPPVKGFALSLVQFAQERPEDFKELFLATPIGGIDDIAERLGHLSEIENIIAETFHVDSSSTHSYYFSLLEYCFSLCCLCVSTGIAFTTEEISFRIGCCAKMVLIGGLVKDDFTGQVPSAEPIPITFDESFKRATASISTPKISALESALIQQVKYISHLRDNPQYLTEDEWKRVEKEIDTVSCGHISDIRSRYPVIRKSLIRTAILEKLSFNVDQMAVILGLAKNSVYKNKQRLRKLLGDNYLKLM